MFIFRSENSNMAVHIGTGANYQTGLCIVDILTHNQIYQVTLSYIITVMCVMINAYCSYNVVQQQPKKCNSNILIHAVHLTAKRRTQQPHNNHFINYIVLLLSHPYHYWQSFSALVLLVEWEKRPVNDSLQHPLLSRGQWANPGSPGKWPLKRSGVGVCMVVLFSDFV